MNKKLGMIALSLAPVAAMAEEVATHAASSGRNDAYMAAGLCMGLAAAAVGFSQSRASAAALEGIGRNPGAADKIQTPLILSLALMESIGLLAFVIAFLLQGK
jgi:F-type H+-transporting ATPase subunit c